MREISIDEYFAQNVQTEKSVSKLPRILMNGPCDLESIKPLMQTVGEIHLETNYTNEHGILIVSRSHSVHILESGDLTEKEILNMTKVFPFIDAKSFSTKIFSGDYDIIFLSTLIDTRFNVYRNIKNGYRIAYGYWYDLTDTTIWDKIVSGEYPQYSMKFTYEILKKFRESYEYEGSLKPEQLVENYKKIRSLLPTNTLMVLLLGSEKYFDDSRESIYRANRHKQINPFFEKEFANYENVKLINYTKYIHSKEDYT